MRASLTKDGKLEVWISPQRVLLCHKATDAELRAGAPFIFWGLWRFVPESVTLLLPSSSSSRAK